MDNTYLVDVHHLSKSFYGKYAVKDVSLKIKRGEIFGFLGPNGGGKTTTIRMLCGLLTPDSGTGTCLGFDIRENSPEMKYYVGYVPQSFGLYQDLTVKENLNFIANVYEEKKAKRRVKEVMDEFGLGVFKNKLAGQLSGGWKQRLSLAAAVIHEPKLLLLDEPTAGVDPKARRDFWNFITSMSSSGISSLVSTHYMDEAERCNRLAYIVNGNLMAEGTSKEIIAKSALITYAATGQNLPQLIDMLQKEEGIEQVVAWGNEIRIVSTNEEALQKVMQKHTDYQWRKVPTGLEDVFIHFVNEGSAKSDEKD